MFRLSNFCLILLLHLSLLFTIAISLLFPTSNVFGHGFGIDTISSVDVQGKKISNVKFIKEWAKFYFIPPTNLKHSEIYISRSGKKTYIGTKVNEENRKKLFKLLKKF